MSFVLSHDRRLVNLDKLHLIEVVEKEAEPVSGRTGGFYVVGYTDDRREVIICGPHLLQSSAYYDMVKMIGNKLITI